MCAFLLMDISIKIVRYKKGKYISLDGKYFFGERVYEVTEDRIFKLNRRYGRKNNYYCFNIYDKNAKNPKDFFCIGTFKGGKEAETRYMNENGYMNLFQKYRELYDIKNISGGSQC